MGRRPGHDRDSRGRGCACLAAILACGLAPADVGAQTPVDLELVFAVDASGSVDDSEYALQIGGIAAAITDPSVLRAIADGAHQRIAVAMVVWAGADTPKDATGWSLVASEAQAEAFAASLRSRKRYVRGGETGIGAGIAAALAIIEENNFEGVRRAVDVSGDGIENSGSDIHPSFRDRAGNISTVEGARAAADLLGVAVNGLAILTEVPDLDVYYDANVRTGPDSFVMKADGYEDFANAMLAKLLREIGNDPKVTGPALDGRQKAG